MWPGQMVARTRMSEPEPSTLCKPADNEKIIPIEDERMKRLSVFLISFADLKREKTDLFMSAALPDCSSEKREKEHHEKFLYFKVHIN